MAFVSDPSFHTLHVTRIRGRAPIDSVRAAVGRDDVLQLLRQLAALGHVEYHTGRAAGWGATADGREAHAALLAAERAAAAADADVRCAYDSFVAVNDELVAACSAHQMRDDGTLNDHTDAAYDASVVDRLAAVHEQALPICTSLASAMGRFGNYGTRLGQALDGVRAGEHEWFTSLVLDSYHTVWFELHEDLLQTLGLDRTSETARH